MSSPSREQPLKRQKVHSTNEPINENRLSTLTRPISPPHERPSEDSVRVPALNTDGGGTKNIFEKLLRLDQQASMEGNTRANTSKGNTRDNSPMAIDLTGDDDELMQIENQGSASRGKFKEKRLRSSISTGKASMAKPSDSRRIIPSPFYLTKVEDLPDSENTDAMGIQDILGDPMIKEAWIFSFVMEIDWLMAQFDPDVRGSVIVKLIYGSWEEESRKTFERNSRNYPNVQIIPAPKPENYGTHHTKMIFLSRHDDHVQVFILSANMISFDWENMTQAFWASPFLPLISKESKLASSQTSSQASNKSIGQTFKTDLLDYFKAYALPQIAPLVSLVWKYDFSSVRAIFIGSVPGIYEIGVSPNNHPKWGWYKLKTALGNVTLSDDGSKGRIVAQVSSVATLGKENIWLTPVLFSALSAHRGRPSNFTLSKKSKSSDEQIVEPKLQMVFPTADEIRNSLKGYASGSCVHFKSQLYAQRQIAYIKPMLCYWDSQSVGGRSTDRLAGRNRAAPHAKTYIRYADEDCTRIEWALFTSANISLQAWGSNESNFSGRLMGPREAEFKICSWEAGVLVYPELFREEDDEILEIVPVFKKNTPDVGVVDARKKIIGLRMPYNLPLRPYGPEEMPWCDAMDYKEPDWMGLTWPF
ncbi:hypothetical protein RUND412_001773 [Rhizina undulata]